MRTVARIRVTICSMMLACTGTLSVPLAAHAEGDPDDPLIESYCCR
jgi:hypothetical protein